MAELSGLVLVVGLGCLLAGLIGLIFKRFRRRAGRLALFGIAATIAGAFGAIQLDNSDEIAKSKGFESASQMREANKAGLQTVEEWQAHQKRLAQESALAEKALRDAAEAGGFQNVSSYEVAKQAGIATAAEWSAHQAKLQRAERLHAYSSALGDNLLEIDEMERTDGPSLHVHMKTNGLTLNLDFADVGQKVASIAKELRSQNAPYETLVVMVSVDTIDKYGNAGGLSKAAVLIWDIEELAKINLDYGPTFIFRNAREVTLSRLGKEMTQAYCENNDLSDPRYCL